FLRDSTHPDVKKYLDVRNFKAYHIEYGDLMWGDFDLIFPIIELYQGKIEYTRPQQSERTHKPSKRKTKSIPSNRRRISSSQSSTHSV
ncbi:MAG TPA: hypothetical protein VGM92_10820, partial [Candidatus Kapabacteria bacterium]